MHNYRFFFNFSYWFVLQFDGSLKDIIPPFATCASVILDDASGDIIALGAKEVVNSSPLGKKITSADVEYEGFLLGLNCLLDLFQQCPEIVRKNTIHGSDSGSGRNVIIRGDCKTIMDQFKGKSIPRKLRFYHESCMDVLEQLESCHGVTFSFQHVGREHNELCDGMCKVLLLHLQDRVTNDVFNLIQTTEMNYIASPLPRNTKKRMNHLETPFRAAIDQVSNLNGHISTFMRSYLLCDIYHASKRVGDQVAKRLVGMAMYEQSRQFQKSRLKVQGSSIFQNLGLIGMTICHDSLVAMELDQEARKLQKVAKVEFGNVSLLHVDEELKNLQSYLGQHLEEGTTAAKIILQDLASDEEVYEKLSQWNDKMLRMVNCSSPVPGEEYPYLMFYP